MTSKLTDSFADVEIPVLLLLFAQVEQWDCVIPMADKKELSLASNIFTDVKII